MIPIIAIALATAAFLDGARVFLGHLDHVRDDAFDIAADWVLECAVFSNRGARLSSDLIRAADAIADQRWPGERHFTYVNPRKVANSNPGRCFVRADWKYVRVSTAKNSPRACTKTRKLLILERVSVLPPREHGAANSMAAVKAGEGCTVNAGSISGRALDARDAIEDLLDKMGVGR